jgi:hypothetical protein
MLRGISTRIGDSEKKCCWGVDTFRGLDYLTFMTATQLELTKTDLTETLAQTFERRVRQAQEAAADDQEGEGPYAYATVIELQSRIDDGTIWLLEGAAGRAAADALRSGRCFLSNRRYRDAYGMTVPARDDVRPGTQGSIELSIRFYDL